MLFVITLSSSYDSLTCTLSLIRDACTRCDVHAHYACVADSADAMDDAWEDTVGCAQADCLLGNVLKCLSTVQWGLHGIVHIGT